MEREEVVAILARDAGIRHGRFDLLAVIPPVRQEKEVSLMHEFLDAHIPEEEKRLLRDLTGEPELSLRAETG